ncbi:MAG: UPF0175 family protein [Promethearchaeota archaeon]
MSDKINIKLPLDLVKLSGLNYKNLERKSLLIWALELYSEGKISLSKAANLAKMNIDKFLFEFRKRHLKHIGGLESIKQAQKDFDSIQNLIGE